MRLPVTKSRAARWTESGLVRMASLALSFGSAWARGEGVSLPLPEASQGEEEYVPPPRSGKTQGEGQGKGQSPNKAARPRPASKLDLPAEPRELSHGDAGAVSGAGETASGPRTAAKNEHGAPDDSKAATSTQGEESATKPADAHTVPHGEEAAAEAGTKRELSADKPLVDGHGASVTKKGSGFVWFGAVFAALLVVIFVFT